MKTVPLYALALAALLAPTLITPLRAQDAPRDKPRGDEPRAKGEPREGGREPARAAEGQPGQRGREGVRPQPDQPNDQQLDQIRAKIRELRTAGRGEEADNLQRQLTARREGGGAPEARGDGNRRGQAEGRVEVRVVEVRGEGQDARARHLQVAVDNLRAAGMNELADNIAREAGKMQPQPQGRGNVEPGRGQDVNIERKPGAEPNTRRGEVAPRGDLPRGEPGNPGQRGDFGQPGNAGQRGGAGGQPGQPGQPGNAGQRGEGSRVAPGFRGDGAFQPPAAELQNVIRQMREEMMEMQQSMRELRRQLDEKKK